MPAPLSPAALALIREPVLAHVVTLMADGSPQVTPVWIDTDGEHLLVNTVRGRLKQRNLERDPRVAASMLGFGSGTRGVQVRGRVVEMTTEGADEHVRFLTRKYEGKDTYDHSSAGKERVLVHIAPERVREIGMREPVGQPPQATTPRPAGLAVQEKGAALTPAMAAYLRENVFAHLATLMPDGSPQVTPIWVGTDGERVLMNCSIGAQKQRNVHRDPRVAISVMGLDDPWRCLWLMGRAEEVSEGAERLIDDFSLKYKGEPRYPRRPGMVRVTLAVTPARVTGRRL
jgi:PPOX class probable F420-dependent enzyme